MVRLTLRAKFTGLKLIANPNRPNVATTRNKRAADVVITGFCLSRASAIGM